MEKKWTSSTLVEKRLGVVSNRCINFWKIHKHKRWKIWSNWHFKHLGCWKPLGLWSKCSDSSPYQGLALLIFICFLSKRDTQVLVLLALSTQFINNTGKVYAGGNLCNPWTSIPFRGNRLKLSWLLVGWLFYVDCEVLSEDYALA